MIKIQPSGDYVQLIYVDPVGESVQQELKSDTDAFECSYDSDNKLYLQFGLMRFENPDPTDFIINGSAVTDAADFISKLNALFTGGSGGGSSLLPTIGTGTATGDVIGDLNGHILSIINGNVAIGAGGPNTDLFVVTNSLGSQLIEVDAVDNVTTMYATDANGVISSFSSLVFNGTTDNNVSFQLYSHNNGGDEDDDVYIKGDALTHSIEYEAATHTFNGVLNLPIQAAPASPNDGDMWREDNTNTGLKIRINGVTKTIVVS